LRRHLVATGILWAVLTAIGEALSFLNLYPTVGSAEAEDFDRIFRTLLFMGMPVFCFVLAVLFYSFVGFRTRGTPTEDGPPTRGTGAFPKAWLAVTGSLAVITMIYPGLIGLSRLQPDLSGYGWGAQDAQLVIKVTGLQWTWRMEYVDAGVTVTTTQGKELVLPIDTTVKFEVNSADVVHSLWIPAFRMRIDAMPGRTTHMTVKPTELGSFEDDDAFRVQCSALCGMDHALMRFPVRVVSRSDFDTWLADQKQAQQPGK